MFWHPDVLLHDTGEGVFEAAQSPLIASPEPHPESAGRILNMKAMLERGPLAGALEWAPVRLHAEAELEMVHTPEYLDDLRSSAAAGGRRYTATTVLGPRSWPALVAAASAAMGAASAAVAQSSTPTYALVRPPGHHAQPACADGYCFLNNAALAAETALRAGAERVAIVDFDVHHGNGTQECFWTRSDVVTISLQTVTMGGFRRLGEMLRSLAAESAGGRLALIQEGGYAPTYAAFCLHATLSGALGVATDLADPLAFLPDREEVVEPALARARDALGPYWPALPG